jgi:hypothetical protein
MKSFLLICLVIFLNSCASNINSEFIQFNHMNAVIIGGDKLTITLIPTHKNRKRTVIVKIFSKGEYFDNKRISYQQYQQISDIILSIKQEELELPKKQNSFIGILDGGSNSIYFKKGNAEKKVYTYGMSKEYHGKFYEATFNI